LKKLRENCELFREREREKKNFGIFFNRDCCFGFAGR